MGTYPPQVKDRAVEMVLTHDRHAWDVAAQLGLPVGTVRRWVRLARERRRGQSWSDQVAQHFAFLTHRGTASRISGWA